MGATNSTENLGLSQFGDNDKPTFRGDYNGDMGKIDQFYGSMLGNLNNLDITKEDKASVDSDVASNIDTINSQTRTTINNVITKSFNPYRAINASHPRKSEIFNLPTGLGWSDIPLTIGYNGANYECYTDISSFKNAGGNTYYVSTSGANTANTGAIDSPWQTIGYALTQIASGDTIVIKDSILYRANLDVSGTPIGISCNIIGANPNTILSVSDVLSWQSTGVATVWKATRSNVLRVVDLNYGRDGFEYYAASSLAECNVNRGSWFDDGINLFVNTLNGLVPDNSKILALLNDGKFNFRCDNNDVKIYTENLSFYGSTNNLQVNRNSGTYNIYYYGKNCKYLYGCAVSGGDGNAINVHGAAIVGFQNCRAAYAANDGFNYHTNGTYGGVVKFFEINCEGDSNGFWGTSQNDMQNGSTAHDGAIGVRINGNYHYTKGTPVADVMPGTKSVNLSCNSWDSKGSGIYNGAFSAQQSGAEMWLYDCAGWGTDNDVYVADGAIVHVDNDTNFISLSGTISSDI